MQPRLSTGRRAKTSPEEKHPAAILTASASFKAASGKMALVSVEGLQPESQAVPPGSGNVSSQWLAPAALDRSKTLPLGSSSAQGGYSQAAITLFLQGT